MALKHAVFRALNRRGLRYLLPHLASAIKTAKYRRLCRVWTENRMWFHVHPDGVLVEREIHLASISELEHITRDYWFHQYTPGPGDVVIDVGAGSGWETMFFSRLVGDTGRVISIEAHPETFACLEEMIRRNRLDNVSALCCAVSAEPGVAAISDNDDHQANTISTDQGLNGGILVPMRTLAEIACTEGLPYISFLKMNIEGAERYALPGLGDMAAHTYHVAISCHDFRADYGQSDFYRTRTEIEAWLTNAGFHIETRPDSREWIRDVVYGVLN